MEEGTFDNTKARQAMIDDILQMPLVPFLDERLNRRPTPYDFTVDNPIPSTVLAEALMQKMEALRGIGLSANQVGIDCRMFVMNDGMGVKAAVFNPKIIGASKETTLIEEGCLSIPGLFLTLKRPASIAASFQNEKGEDVVQDFHGLAARIFLHEYDHMEGHNFTHHASRFKLQRAALRLRNYNRKMAKLYAQQFLANMKKVTPETGIPNAE